MRSLPVSIALAALVNTLSLALAAWMFEHFTINLLGFVIAVVLFTGFSVALRLLLRRTRVRYVRAYTVTGGLLLTFVALQLTDLLSTHEGFGIDGLGTWLGVTVLVWAAGIAYGEIDTEVPATR